MTTKREYEEDTETESVLHRATKSRRSWFKPFTGAVAALAALYWINPDTKAKEVYSSGTDTAGIAVDPSDDEAVWIAHVFAAADKDGYATKRIAFGKVFGTP